MGRRMLVLAYAALSALAPASVTLAAEPATRPALPALEQLNRDCITLHQGLQGGILRVQMPAPKFVGNTVAQQDDPRWGKYQLNPNVKRVLSQQRGGGYGNNAGNIYNNTVTTQPAGNRPTSDGNAGSSHGGGNNYDQQPSQQQQPQSAQQQVSQQQAVPSPNPAPRAPAPPPPPNVQQRQVQQAGSPQQQPAVPTQQEQASDAGPQVGPGPSQQPGYNDNNGRAQGITIVVPPPQVQNGLNIDNGQQLNPDNRLGNNRLNVGFVANNLGLLLNEDGHVLVPIYIEREALADQPVKLVVGDGEAVEARFIGSDQQTQLTVVQLPPTGNAAVVRRDAERARIAKGGAAAGKVAGPGEEKAAKETITSLRKPLKLSGKPLAEGSVVLVLSPMDMSPRLAVWNGAARDAGGVIVTIDGEIAGIARGGQFLSGAACQLIANKIIQHGAVKRTTLGIFITQVDAAEAARLLPAELGADKPTLRVDQVVKGSVAERGGLQAGDLILGVGKEPVHNIPALAAAIAAREGETKLSVLRDGKLVTLTVNLVQK